MQLLVILFLYFDFTFDNINFDLRKRSGFKVMLQLLNMSYF